VTDGPGSTGDPKVVIAHDFAELYGGAERIIAEVAHEFPQAPFYAILGRPEVAERIGVAERFHTLYSVREPFLSHYRLAAPFYPWLVRHRRLPEADVLVTSSYSYIHGIKTRNDAPQLCYCYSALRLAWSQTDAYGEHTPGGPLARWAFPAFAAAMRRADRRASRRVTRYVTESPFTAEQIERFYGVEAQVVDPPIDTDLFHPGGELGDSFLFAGRLVEAYKKPSLVVKAFAQLPDLKLRIAGDGPEMEALKAIATPNITFLGHLDNEQLIGEMQSCLALVFPSIDDFGLVPVEVAACGRPTLAFAGGGALHTVADGVNGTFFGEQSVGAIVSALKEFQPTAYDPAAIREHAMRWDRHKFRAEMRRHIVELAR
jgi:glycosyltransferase involved in cell wall biosynthesis